MSRFLSSLRPSIALLVILIVVVSACQASPTATEPTSSVGGPWAAAASGLSG